MKQRKKNVRSCSVISYFVGIAALLTPFMTLAGKNPKSLKKYVLSAPIFQSENLKIILNDKGNFEFKDPKLQHDQIPEELWQDIARSLKISKSEQNKKITNKQLVLGKLIFRHYLKNWDNLDNKARFAILRQAADCGSEDAIRCLLFAYHYLKFGLNEIDRTIIQAEGLKLAKYYADQGSEEAIQVLLDAYFKGYFGLEINDPAIQQEKRTLIKNYADKGYKYAVSKLLHPYGYKNQLEIDEFKHIQYYADQGFEDAIFLLLDSCKKLNPPLELTTTTNVVLELAKNYADQGSEMAVIKLTNVYCNIDFLTEKEWNQMENYIHQATRCSIKCLIETYSKQEKFKNINPKEIEQETLKLIEHYAEKNFDEAIWHLLMAYNNGHYGLNKDNPSIQKKGLDLAKKYADTGNKSAIFTLLMAHTDQTEITFGLNVKDPTVQQEGLRLTKYYAHQGVERAILYLLEAYLRGFFGLDKDHPLIQQEGLQLLRYYADQGLESTINLMDFIYNHGGFGFPKESPQIQAIFGDKYGYQFAEPRKFF